MDSTTVHDKLDTIKIVIKRLDFSVLIAPQNDAKLIVPCHVTLRIKSNILGHSLSEGEGFEKKKNPLSKLYLFCRWL